MSEYETAEAIDSEATRWVALIDRAGDDPQVKLALEAWLDGGDRRRGAYFRAQAAWAMLDRASVLGAGMPAADEEPDDQASPARRRFLWVGAAAGAAAASLALLAYTRPLWPQTDERIETALGEIRRVPLKDGSMAAVNTSTSLAVQLMPELRKIALYRGEAWFEVAHDRDRPFIVEAGDVRVKAVGTAFAVRKTPAGVAIQVTEGVVQVWTIGHEGEARLVNAGARTVVNDKGEPTASVQASTDIDRSLAWRTGQLVFDGDRLGDAAADFNRYNRVQVRIEDQTLADERFVGRFRTNEPQSFARAVAEILDARADSRDGEIVLTRN